MTTDETGLEPRSLPHGLATVALLKARFDEGVDQIDMFMPLVTDTIENLRSDIFLTVDVQNLLLQRHGIALPQHTLTTLLKRAAHRQIIKREFSGYVRLRQTKSAGDVQAKRQLIEVEQQRLAQELRRHAAEHGYHINSDEEALAMILSFLKSNEVDILLGAKGNLPYTTKLTSREGRLVAEFAQDLISTQSELAAILNNILEGLVVYNTAFLSDITAPTRKINGLHAFLDTQILFRILGYEGDAEATLGRETLQLLKNAGVQCFVFDKTLHEMQSILKFHENRIGTSQGVRSLNKPMGRYFMTNHYSASDIRQIGALLSQELVSLGIRTFRMPKHVPEYTLDETKLAQALADQHTNDPEVPRVRHDVDCVAGVLTVRAGKRSSSLSGVKAIFVTSSPRVVANVQRWYEEQDETGIGPIIHIRALSNLAWLRKPALSVNLKIHELVALCRAALRPSRKTWDRFLQHLNTLEKSQILTSDEAIAVVVSELTEDLLADVEDDEADASTLSEIVDRVRASYEADAKMRVEQVMAETKLQLDGASNAILKKEAEVEARALDAEKREHAAAEKYRRLRLAVDGKASRLAHVIARFVFQLLSVVVVLGALALILSHPFETSPIGILIVVAIAVFVSLELLGILQHMSSLRSDLERFLLPHIRRTLGADELKNPRSMLGLE